MYACLGCWHFYLFKLFDNSFLTLEIVKKTKKQSILKVYFLSYSAALEFAQLSWTWRHQAVCDSIIVIYCDIILIETNQQSSILLKHQLEEL